MEYVRAFTIIGIEEILEGENNGKWFVYRKKNEVGPSEVPLVRQGIQEEGP